MKNHAFTLIELLVVVLIIGILAAIALPQYQKAVLKARFTQAKIMARAISDAEEVYYMANGEYTNVWENLDIDTPPASSEFTQGSGVVREFSWGNCTLWAGGGGSVSCRTGDILLHLANVHSTGYEFEMSCQGLNTDLNSAENQICKAETGKSTPDETSSKSLVWYY